MEITATDPVWHNVALALASGESIAWDGCHKIYVLMDKGQTEQMREYGYDPLIEIRSMPVKESLEIVKGWFFDSCSLRFVQGVRTVVGDPNDGFESLIPQGYDWDPPTVHLELAYLSPESGWVLASPPTNGKDRS